MSWWRNLIARLRRESEIPAPPFKASKRVAKIMYGVWYGRMTPDRAREQARGWGFSEAEIAQMIGDATQPPSYWSRPER